MTPLILPAMSMAAEKTFRIMLLPLVLLAYNDCEIDRTWSSSIMIKGSRPFYWILLKEANLLWSGVGVVIRTRDGIKVNFNKIERNYC